MENIGRIFSSSKVSGGRSTVHQPAPATHQPPPQHPIPSRFARSHTLPSNIATAPSSSSPPTSGSSPSFPSDVPSLQPSRQSRASLPPMPSAEEAARDGAEMRPDLHSFASFVAESARAFGPMRSGHHENTERIYTIDDLSDDSPEHSRTEEKTASSPSHHHQPQENRRDREWYPPSHIRDQEEEEDDEHEKGEDELRQLLGDDENSVVTLFAKRLMNEQERVMKMANDQPHHHDEKDEKRAAPDSRSTRDTVERPRAQERKGRSSTGAGGGRSDGMESLRSTRESVSSVSAGDLDRELRDIDENKDGDLSYLTASPAKKKPIADKKGVVTITREEKAIQTSQRPTISDAPLTDSGDSYDDHSPRHDHRLPAVVTRPTSTSPRERKSMATSTSSLYDTSPRDAPSSLVPPPAVPSAFPTMPPSYPYLHPPALHPAYSHLPPAPVSLPMFPLFGAPPHHVPPHVTHLPPHVHPGMSHLPPSAIAPAESKGRLSPRSLQRKAAANLAVLETLGEAQQQLSTLEQSRAMAVLERETADLAEQLRMREVQRQHIIAEQKAREERDRANAQREAELRRIQEMEAEKLARREAELREEMERVQAGHAENQKRMAELLEKERERARRIEHERELELAKLLGKEEAREAAHRDTHNVLLAMARPPTTHDDDEKKASNRHAEFMAKVASLHFSFYYFSMSGFVFQWMLVNIVWCDVMYRWKGIWVQ